MDGDPVPLKRCSKCKRALPATPEYFSRNRSKVDGFGFHCKECRGRKFRLVVLPPPASRDGFRRCTKCLNEYPATPEYFYRKKDGNMGLNARCNQCEGARVKQWTSNNPDIGRKRRGIWERNHPDKAKASSRARSTRWMKLNPEKARVHRNRRYSRKKSVPATFTVTQWYDCLEYFNHACAVCGKRADFWTLIAQDHWIPVSKGGSYSVENIVPLCHSKKDGEGGCNNSKNDKDAAEWLVSKFGKRRAAEIMARINLYFAQVKKGEAA